MKSSVWKRHAGMFATTTAALGVSVVVIHVATWAMVLSGTIGWYVGFGLQTIASYSAFTVMHEAAHGNIHGRFTRWAWVDGLLGWTSSVLLVAPYPAFQLLHLRHHSRTNHADDPDVYVAGQTWWSIALRCATIVPHYYITFLFGGDELGPRRKAILPIAIGFVAIVATIVVIAAATGKLAIVLALWIGPAILANTLLAFLFDWLPHQPHRQSERMHNTRIVLAPGLWILTLWQNYHLVHHLFPRVPFYRYATFFDEIRDDLEDLQARIDVYP